MDIDINKFSEKAKLIDEELNDALRGDVPNLNDAINYHMGTGGKRIRPLLAIMACEALGAPVEQIIPFASACELMHNWFLVHDDIEDGDTVRRDKPSVWVKYGVPHAINVGDYMAHKVFELILKSKEKGVEDGMIVKLFKETVETALETAEGQALDINLRKNNSPSENEYLESIRRKTARYLTMPIIGAAIISRKDDLINDLVKFGTELGIAFQITDDILDLTEGKGRGETGRDIKEGKRSIMIVNCLSKCEKDEKEKILNILNKPATETTDEDIRYAKSLLEKYGSIKYAREKAEHHSEEAKAVADSMPPKLKEVLHFFAEYIVKRKK